MSITAYHGNCLEIMKGLPDKSVDLFLCDLPFGCLTNGVHKTGINKLDDKTGEIIGKKAVKLCDWDIKIDLVEFWKQVKRLAKNDNTPIIHFCTTKFGSELINSNPSWFRYDLVWNKDRGTSFLSANKMPLRSHEMIYVFSKSGAYYNRIDDKGTFTSWKAHRCVKSVITIKKPNTLEHPTEKPVNLYKWLIERYCPPGGTVLDPTAGSFNSCFAAFELDREAIGIEQDAGFYKKASDKMDALE